MVRNAWVVATAAALTACATPYQPKGLSGGYDEARLGDNVFRVSFEGNAFTSDVKATDYALLRSADLTLERGFRFFALSTNGVSVRTSGSASRNYGHTSSTPSAINTIVCFKDRPEGDLLVFDARQVRASLRAKYGIDEEEQSVAKAPPPRTKPIDPYATSQN
jgi:hypothetical protein